MSEAARRPSSTAVLRALLLALIALGLLARLAVIVRRPALEHDEAISYLAAAGQQGRYARLLDLGAPPLNTWAPARTWQHFLQPEDCLCLGRIRADLAQQDVHPPLYFWLLHLWIRPLGVRVWSGPLLNLLWDALLAGALFRLGRLCLGDGLAAGAAVALWALSPVAIATSLPARPYALFALLAVGFTWALGAWLTASPGRARQRLALGLLIGAAAGLLTHYYFALVVLGGLLAAQRYGGRAQAARLALILAGAALLAAGLHPGFLAQWSRAAGHGFAADRAAARLTAAISALLALALPIVFALLGPLAAGALWRGTPPPPYERRLPPLADLPLLLAGCFVAGSVALYLLQVSPEHALMDYRYWGPAWPWIALGVARALVGQSFARLGRAAPLLAALGMLILALITVRGMLARPADLQRPAPVDALLVDNPAEGILLPLVFQLDARTPVFAAFQADLLAAPQRWQPGLESGGWYDSLPAYRATAAGRDAILARIAARQSITPAAAPMIWQADAHREAERVYRVAPLVR